MNRIALCGTFEVENYGDRLFSVIAEKELTKRLPFCHLQLYAPTAGKSQSEFKILHPDRPVLFENPDIWRGIVVGGGDIISFSPDISINYQKEWAFSISAHAACWILPVIHRPFGVPVIWNAPGVPHPFTEEQAMLVKFVAEGIDYLSVRDEISLAYLRDAGVKKEVNVVPDTAFSLSNHFTKDTLRPLAEKIYSKYQLSFRSTILFQMQPNVCKRKLHSIAKSLVRLSTELRAVVLLMPIGYCHEDQSILSELRELSKGVFKLVEEKLDCMQTAAVIAHAGYFIGSSLHGNITASVYGVPHLVFNYANLAKLKGFVRLVQEEEREINTIEEAIGKIHLLYKKPSSAHVKCLSQRVEAHFDSIAAMSCCNGSQGLTANEKELLKNQLKTIYQLMNLRNVLEEMQLSYAWFFVQRLSCLTRQIPFLSKIRKLFF